MIVLHNDGNPTFPLLCLEPQFRTHKVMFIFSLFLKKNLKMDFVALKLTSWRLNQDHSAVLGYTQ